MVEALTASLPSAMGNSVDIVINYDAVKAMRAQGIRAPSSQSAVCGDGETDGGRQTANGWRLTARISDGVTVSSPVCR